MAIFTFYKKDFNIISWKTILSLVFQRKSCGCQTCFVSFCLFLLYLNLKEELQQQKWRSTKLRSSTSLLLVIIDCVAVVEGGRLLNNFFNVGLYPVCLSCCIWENSASWIIGQMLQANKMAGFFKVYYLVKEVRNESNFLHADKYQCFLQVDTIILVLLDMPKYPVR